MSYVVYLFIFFSVHLSGQEKDDKRKQIKKLRVDVPKVENDQRTYHKHVKYTPPASVPIECYPIGPYQLRQIACSADKLARSKSE